MTIHIHALEMIIDDMVTDHRTNYRVGNPDIKVATQEYEDGVAEEIKKDVSILFLRFHKDFLDVKKEEMKKESFNGYFAKDVTSYSIKMELIDKQVMLLSRSCSCPSDSPWSDSIQNRFRKERKFFAAAYYELLKRGNYASAKFHNTTVDLLCSISHVKVPGHVTISGLKNSSDTSDSNVPIDDLLLWRIGVDKMQCDMYVDTETVAAIFKLSAFGGNKDLFSAPLEKLKPRKKFHLKK